MSLGMLSCSHCGDVCVSAVLSVGDKKFCCNGCLNVYQLLHDNHLEEYYCLNEKPGQKIKALPKEKFAFLEEESVIGRLLTFRDTTRAQVTFHLPQIHCSSCLWLLEHLSDLEENILYSQVNFTEKNIEIAFKINRFSLRSLAELLAYLGYEPHIDLYEESEPLGKRRNKKAYSKLGITGFAFGNIMMLAFPDYLGLNPQQYPELDRVFSYLNVLLSLPVVFYGAQEFFVNAWYSIRQRYLNIDAPIALAIAVTFLRSLYEVFSHTGSGYFDSMTGIVFFMLLGRTIQNRSYTTLKFNRDYKTYFPIAVARLKGGKRELVRLEEIQEKDVLLIHHQEIIPTDCLLSRGEASIDYSFITGEEKTETLDKGELVYAGGRNRGNTIEVVAIKSFEQNSFIKLWNHQSFRKETDDRESTVTRISKYFSYVVFAIALLSFTVWQFIEPAVGWKAATAVLIIACPCALLLTASFTNGYLMQRFAQRGFYLKNAEVIERLTQIDHIVFDKTGTLTEAGQGRVEALRNDLTAEETVKVYSMVSQSLHPLSKALAGYLEGKSTSKESCRITEIPGQGLETEVNGAWYRVGSAAFVSGEKIKTTEGSLVFVGIDGKEKAIFSVRPELREGTVELMEELRAKYRLSLMSGDQSGSEELLRPLFSSEAPLHFGMSPREKLDAVLALQEKNEKVMMVGDGLNDAGALQQSDVGIAVVQNAFAFSPSSDIIMGADKLQHLPIFIRWAKQGQRLIAGGFIYSVIFNIIGLAFAVTGHLSPLVAAILMPMSSLGIILIAYLGVRFATRSNPELAIGRN